MRQLRFLALGLVVFGLTCTASSSARASVILTGDWFLVGEEPDYPHVHWTANLQITQGAPSGTQYPLSGSFYWTGSNGDVAGTIWGWEDFDNTQRPSYFDSATMRVHIEGYQLRDKGSTVPGYVLGLGVYDADVSADGNHFTNGSWPGSYPGVWHADRVEDVPEPCALILCIGLGLLACALRQRSR
jgi:hypothetical protein